MPTVPSYQIGQVKNVDAPDSSINARASAASFGGGQGQALENLGQGVERAGLTGAAIATDVQDEQNKAIVRDALFQDETASREYLNGNVYNQNGSSAMGVVDKTKTAFDKMSSSRLPSFQNDVQREMYTNRIREVHADHLNHVELFQAQKIKEYDKVTKDAENSSAEKNASLYWNDPAELQKAKFTIIANESHTWKDFPEVVRKQAVSDKLDNLYRSVVQTAEASSPSQALALLERADIKKDYDPRAFRIDQQRLENKVTEQKINALSYEAVNSPGATPETISKVGDENFKDPNDRLKFHSLSNARLEEKRTNQTLEYKKQYEEAWTQKRSNPQMAPPNWLDQGDYAKWNKDTEDSAKKSRGEEVANNYGRLLALPSAELAKLNLADQRTYLEPHQYNFIKELQADILGKGNKKSPGFTKAIDEAKSDASKLDMFQVTSKDSDAVVKQKQDNFHQYIAVYGERLMQIPEDKKGDWNVQRKIKEELLGQEVIKKSLFGIDWLWPDSKGKPNFQNQFEGKTQPTEITPQSSNYGTRPDGTPKGPGYFGELQRPDGKVSTELSIGVELNGKETEIPSLVPTLTKQEVDSLISGDKPTPQIIQKAADHAKERIAAGKSPFAEQGEQIPVESIPGGISSLAQNAVQQNKEKIALNSPESRLDAKYGIQGSSFKLSDIAAGAGKALDETRSVGKYVNPLFYVKKTLEGVGSGISSIASWAKNHIDENNSDRAYRTNELANAIQINDVMERSGIHMPDIEDKYKAMKQASSKTLQSYVPYLAQTQDYINAVKDVAAMNAHKIDLQNELIAKGGKAGDVFNYQGKQQVRTK